MSKRIASLSSNPHTVSLTDRQCSLFIDPKSGSIFVDEGDGEGRMNGVVFSLKNKPSFAVWTFAGPDHQLVLDYGGVQYVIGVSDDGEALQRWAEEANQLLSSFENKPQGIRCDLPPGTARVLGTRVAAGDPVSMQMEYVEFQI